MTRLKQKNSSRGTNPADDLLHRLESVRETGRGQWLARCPAHPDKSPSLSVRDIGDGTVLLHCFAGCAAAEVTAAVDLTLADLFPGKPEHVRPSRRRSPVIHALAAIDQEANIVAVIASDIRQARAIDEATWHRLTTAAARIGAAREAVR